MTFLTLDSTRLSRCMSKSSQDPVRKGSGAMKKSQLTGRIDQPDLLLSTEMLPADAEDFENWYRQEHLKDGSKINGWRRTERFELIDGLRTEDAPKYLTLVSCVVTLFRHTVPANTDKRQLFLDGASVSVEDLQRAAQSSWTQRIVGGFKKFRTGAYSRSSHHHKESSSTSRTSSL